MHMTFKYLVLTERMNCYKALSENIFCKID
ncbi:hypothetical protein [Enterobacter asburiae]